jgi:Na+-transporting NADH:ubiquinone oxidoreductase subunit NqrE
MEHAISLFFRSIFVDNMIFAYFLGMCSYLAVSKNVKTSLGLGLAVTFVLLITVPVDYLLQTKVLSADGILGVDLTYLSFILFIAVIAGIVQLVEMIVERYSPSLYAAMGNLIPRQPDRFGTIAILKLDRSDLYNDTAAFNPADLTLRLSCQVRRSEQERIQPEHSAPYR